MTLNSFAKSVEKLVIDNSPAILTAIGVTGTVTSAYLAGRASFKAAKVIADAEFGAKMKGEEKLSNREKFELTWKLYIPAAGAAVTTIACVVCANRIENRRAAALAAAYSLSEKAFTEYRDKIQEKLGVNKERAARDELAQDRVNQRPYNSSELIITGNGDVICFDQYSGRYFESSMEEIKKAMNDVNYLIINDGFASLGDFYDKINLPQTRYSEEVGWNTDHPLDIMFSTTMNDENKPCLAIDYRTVPTRGYNHFR